MKLYKFLFLILNFNLCFAAQDEASGPAANTPVVEEAEEAPLPLPEFGIIRAPLLNVRSEESTDGKLLCQIKGKDPIRIKEKSSEGNWWKIDLSSQECSGAKVGWVSGTFFLPNDESFQAYVVSNGDLRIRSQPKKGNNIQCELNYGSRLSVIGTSSNKDWLDVVVDQPGCFTRGYVYKGGISRKDPQGYMKKTNIQSSSTGGSKDEASSDSSNESTDVTSQSREKTNREFVQSKDQASILEAFKPYSESEQVENLVELADQNAGVKIDPNDQRFKLMAASEGVNLRSEPNVNSDVVLNLHFRKVKINGKIYNIGSQLIPLERIETPNDKDCKVWYKVRVFHNGADIPSGVYRNYGKVGFVCETVVNKSYDSIKNCFRYVKQALKMSGMTKDYLSGTSAKLAGGYFSTKQKKKIPGELQSEGFVNIMEISPWRELINKDPKNAPRGSVLVYKGGTRGHIEIKIGESGQGGYASDFYQEYRPGSRTLTGVYVKKEFLPK